MSDLEKLNYSVEAYSNYSANFKPDNILSDNPADLGSRWSAASPESAADSSNTSSRERQWLLLKLERPSILHSITFGKCNQPHPCNVKELHVYGGIKPSPHDTNLLCRAVLRNDSVPETFGLKPIRGGHMLPCRYIRIEPVSTHCPNYNLSIWHVSLHGSTNESLVDRAYSSYSQHKEFKILRLTLKHLRQKGLMAAFESLCNTVTTVPYSIPFEHPLITSLHTALVCQGDFDLAEAILSKAAFRPISALDSEEVESASAIGPTLLDEYIQDKCTPRPVWTRFDGDSSTYTRDGETPSPRGGHQLVFVNAFDGHPPYLFLFGGWNGTEDLAELWRFDIHGKNKGRWALLSRNTAEEGGPRARSCHKACLDEATGHIYLLGCFVDMSDVSSADTSERRPDLKNDFWRYHTRGEKAGSWERISEDTAANGGPKLVFDHQMVIDPKGRKLYLFGGKIVQADTSTSEYCGFYKYDLNSGEWRRHNDWAFSESPSQVKWPESMLSRVGHSVILDSDRRVMYIFAGQRDETYLSDLWCMDLETEEITQTNSDYSLEGGPLGTFTQRATFDPISNECYVMAGLMRDKNGKDIQSSNALWIRRMESGKWITVQNLEGDFQDTKLLAPVPRYAHQMVYDPSTKTHYLFGGTLSAVNDSGARLGDLWSLQLIRPKAAEVLQRAKFLVRKQRFIEMCQSEPNIDALNYLQTSLYSLINHEDIHEAAAYRQCMHHLLAAGDGDEEMADEDEIISSAGSGMEEKDAIMASSQDFTFTSMRGKAVDRKTWSQRTQTFTALLEFFPTALQEPIESLVDLVR